MQLYLFSITEANVEISIGHHIQRRRRDGGVKCELYTLNHY